MKTRLCVGILALSAGSISAEAFRLESKPSDSIKPERSIRQDDTGITVTYEFPGAVMAQDDLYPETVRLDIPGFGINSNTGEPAWPIRTDSFEIPEGYEPEVSVVSSSWYDLGYPICPARPPLIDSSDECYSHDNVPPVGSFAGSLPANPVEISDIQTYRDRNILYVNVVPVKYKSGSGSKVCENLTYRICFKAAISRKSEKSSNVKHTVDEEFMKSLFSYSNGNSDQDMMKANNSTKWIDAPYYLILSVPSYKTSIEKFISWKKCMGFNVHAIYSNSWTATSIKDKIQSIYDRIGTLDYALLIGDAKTLPPVRHPESADSEFAHSSDYTFGCMDGPDDMEQDVIIGRLNVSNSSEASTVINKIINYEKNPSLNVDFYHNATHSAYFQEDISRKNYEGRRFSKTSEDIRDGLSSESFSINRIYYTENSVTPTNWNKGKFAYGEAISPELLKPTFNWDGSTSDIINAINTGSFYVLHRGHGSDSGWGHPSLSINSLSNIHNNSLLPVFFNIHCQSGAFGHTEVIVNPYNKKYRYIDLSFSEALLRKTNGGAVGIIAASEISYSGRNDALAMEMFQSIWPKSSILTDFPKYTSNGIDHDAVPVYALGKILKKGTSGLSSKYTGGFVNYTKRIFHCFGDPSMQMYTDVPHEVEYFKIPDNTYGLRTNEPIQMALVTKNGTVKISNGTNFDISEFYNDIVLISCTGHNIIPRISEIDDIDRKSVKESKITNIDISSQNIELKYVVNDSDNTYIRIKSINGLITLKKEIKTIGGTESISTSDFEKGFYIVELIEDGVLVDYKKVFI